MVKKTVRDIDVAGKRVLVRVDFNVPLDGGVVTDDMRIRAALPTLEFLLDQGAALVLCSHLGRPKGKRVSALRMDPVATRLSELLKRPVRKADDCVGSVAESAVSGMSPGDVVLLRTPASTQRRRPTARSLQNNSPGWRICSSTTPLGPRIAPTHQQREWPTSCQQSPGS